MDGQGVQIKRGAVPELIEGNLCRAGSNRLVFDLSLINKPLPPSLEERVSP